MSIENDIHQTKFNSEYHKMSVNLIYTYNWAMEKAKRFFEKADLTMQYTPDSAGRRQAIVHPADTTAHAR